MPEPEPDMKTASRMGSSTEPVRIEMPPKFGQRMDAEEGWLAAKNENNVIRRFYMATDPTPLRKSSTSIVNEMIGVWWLYAKVKNREYSAVVDEG
tara:strand:+ start:448 stop:732 length:285 start_codon:yes stop_codon:yes gene_type:complete